MKPTFLARVAPAGPPAAPATVGFMTGFDPQDDTLAICKAAMDNVAPGVGKLAG